MGLNISNDSFKDKIAVVTGASRGIGKAIALSLAKAGANVAVCSRSEEIQNVSDEIQKLDRHSIGSIVDVAKKQGVDFFISTVLEKFETVNILVNCAGVIMRDQTLTGASEDDWDYIMNTNLKGTWLCSQAVAKEMKKRKEGAIVNIGSIAARGPFLGQPIYCISKSAIAMFTRLLALELAEFDIRVNAIDPGFIRTDMNVELRPNEKAEREIAKGIPLNRICEPEEIAQVVLFLCSGFSGYITGQSILVDGGWFDQMIAG
jgi:3-oxoacyl-[acyl-carrier protein] reductase